MSRKRAPVTIIAVVAALAAIFLYRCREQAAPGSTSSKATRAVGAGAGGPTASKGERPDPRRLRRASIEGTVTDVARTPIPHARVCADLDSDRISPQAHRDPDCATADDNGRYRIENLYAARYTVGASAPSYRPGAHHPAGDRDRRAIDLGAGEHRPGVDIVLKAGGVEITGVVADISGGPIARAQVRARNWSGGGMSPPVETDEQGRFAMWVRPGRATVSAEADGYAGGSDDGHAPGTFEILMTPESSLAGIVVDARTGAPVAGVRVVAETPGWGGFFGRDLEAADITDERGAFRVTRIEPGRYRVTARSAHGYGVSDGSSLVGLGQHVDGVVIKLHPAIRVSGTVVRPDKTVCTEASVSLTDKAKDRQVWAGAEPDGTLYVEGVLPGTYSVEASCEDHQSREDYPKIVVADQDVDGLVWEVVGGATVRGRVLTASGAPVEDARIWARTVGGPARAQTGWGVARSDTDGSYEMTGLKAGRFKLEVRSDAGNAPDEGWTVEVAANANLEQDLVLEDGGSITGIVVDAQGAPVADISVRAMPVSGRWGWGSDSATTRADGTFVLDTLRPGEYRVIAQRDWSDQLRKPGSTDDDKQGEKVSVVLGKPATVKLVVESQSGTIKGTITDARGEPVSDAFVVAARESDAAGAQRSSARITRWSDDKPVLSSTDGKFTLAKLSPGTYTVRAYRKGGGEAIAENVPVGDTAKLVIRATGTIAGVVTAGSTPIEELTIELRDPKTGLERSESFFRTNGAFGIHDLPAGGFTLTASSEVGKKQLDLELAEGQQKTDLAIVLEELVTLTGRVVDLRTREPVAGMRMMAGVGKEGAGMSFRMSGEGEQPEISDESGRFTIEHAPRGTVTLRGFPKDFRDRTYGFINVVREVNGKGTVDVGDILVAARRVKEGQPEGELGVRFADSPPGTDLDQRQYKVSYIDPKGPAAKTALAVGDIVTSIDGIDITGANVSHAWTLLSAPPGTTLELGLARGSSVKIILAAP
jgi:protocatechuate 3,4-dioxygenase beta subunit